jgi:hypothetical protein
MTVYGYLHFIRRIGGSARFSRVVGNTELMVRVLYRCCFELLRQKLPYVSLCTVINLSNMYINYTQQDNTVI